MVTKQGYIYKITNLVNNKIYIGCTITTLINRFNEHIFRCTKTDSNTKFCNSIRKYGFENFKIDEIEKCDLKEIYDKEKKYIEEYDSFKKGLNSTYGGEGCLGYTHPKEIKDKISKILLNGKSHKGKKYEEIYGEKSKEEREKRSNTVKKMWEEMTEEDKNLRIQKSVQASRNKSKYSEEFIKELKTKLKNGVKVKDLRKEYPEVRPDFFYELKNNRRWKNI
jgi:group I intron endonuclease